MLYKILNIQGKQYLQIVEPIKATSYDFLKFSPKNLKGEKQMQSIFFFLRLHFKSYITTGLRKTKIAVD